MMLEHDLFGKPISTYPDHALDCIRHCDRKELSGDEDRRWKNRAYASTPTTRAPTHSLPTSGCSNSSETTASSWNGCPIRCASPCFQSVYQVWLTCRLDE